MNPLQFWYWENVFNKSQLKEINKIIKEKEDKQYNDAPAKTVKKVANVTGVEYRYLKNILHDTFQKFNLVNKYNFGYSLFEPNDFDNFLHTEYNSKDKGEYDWHIDGGNYFLLWPKSNPKQVEQKLKSSGILIRNMDKKKNLKGSIRVSIGTMEQMKRFWSSFKIVDER